MQTLVILKTNSLQKNLNMKLRTAPSLRIRLSVPSWLITLSSTDNPFHKISKLPKLDKQPQQNYSRQPQV